MSWIIFLVKNLLWLRLWYKTRCFKSNYRTRNICYINLFNLKKLVYFFSNKRCIENFSYNVFQKSRIGIIGNNGSGKTTLLKAIQVLHPLTEGEIILPQDLSIGFVPQIILEYGKLSGAERFNKALTNALANKPTVLCLDEPTNHLDRRQRHSLFKMLHHYNGTLIVVTHDLELLNKCINEIWHLEDGYINCFVGSYDDYIKQYNSCRNKLQHNLKELKCARKREHIKLMQEQKRNKNKKTYGEKKYGKDGCGVKAVANQKQNNAEIASGKKTKNIAENRQEILSELQKI